ncbi:hypothetical protein [Botrimarina mediterranea]|uniref:Uncharacterized protein n=1 Tax=Botrimarina mediterranea TaxID=2528022 RepID=A0A518K2Q6_9BACT|nr:hypothetical protein [Botrimarina mediterranea]QDV72035.1 hypothetical protein Spa11_02050 [Botrimarina mediterranea]QDV76576.1 hypothetical protein K2D_01550 [Planctomycetes bacterium K2D]
MPQSTVVATLPFSAAATLPARSTARALRFDSRGPATLSFAEASAKRQAAEVIGDAYTELLEEATDVARRLGCEVRRRLLGGAVAGGARWERGKLRIVLDVESSPRRRLEVVADALRGDHRLARTSMSDELARYLSPRRAA